MMEAAFLFKPNTAQNGSQHVDYTGGVIQPFQLFGCARLPMANVGIIYYESLSVHNPLCIF